ncbi:hypothetical protein A3E04_00890 [Candidatus Kuenenbacteria bacterium RIFCSPHIGHO2_12_FULL_42_14]|uniref:Type IV pilus assembly protein PilM n=3 Tax=Candidatus Kueneniibacteriota TaxID=1752740 RepID=A0A0G1B9Q6_9BACT|nr:MAG: hypothetical protein UV02_C0004G0005 [Candidatus Kuenenbacteria bacterium GW2011_GWA2_42_15]OGG90723.1 MAG: hypothetical protein A3H55_00880 [Candidatus Kuenenbacteria bacterium RIFCSPLOWO2_02_FULL_42_16]OGG98744.1 MAG: hypothetical protein A3E04_00890 [Candidatus Kuenenbacteria bacterium RIFCSPHIGHO2_12_FULL_42_14]
MRFINSPKTIFGLDISDLSIKAVQIGQNGGKKYIRAINSLPVPLGCISEGIIRENEQVAEIVKQLINDGARKFSTKYAALSLPETKTFIKVLEISDQEMAVEEAIRQELPRHVPIGAEEMQIDWQPVEHDLQKKKFLVGAVPKSIADEYVKVAKLAGVEAVALEIEAQAIARCILPWGKKNRDRGGLSGLFKKNAKTEKDRALEQSGPKMIVDLGATRTSLIFMDNGVIQFTDNLSEISGQKITEKIARELKLTMAEAEKAKVICGTNPKKCKGATLKIINGNINELIKEIANADNFYQTHFGQETNQLAIILGGGGATMLNLDKTLEEKLSRRVYRGDPATNIESALPKRDDLLSFTTAIGLALRNFAVIDA